VEQKSKLNPNYASEKKKIKAEFNVLKAGKKRINPKKSTSVFLKILRLNK
jgi:hypothetical protein